MNLNPGPGVLAIKAAPPVQVEIGLNADNVDSYVLEYRSVLIDAPWSDQATITGNETVFRPSGTLMEGYWRARLQ